MPQASVVFTGWSDDFDPGDFTFHPVPAATIAGNPVTVLTDGDDTTYVESVPDFDVDLSELAVWSDVEPLVLPPGAVVTDVTVVIRFALVDGGAALPHGIEASFTMWIPSVEARAITTPWTPGVGTVEHTGILPLYVISKYTLIVPRSDEEFVTVLPTVTQGIDPAATILTPDDPQFVEILAAGPARAYVSALTEDGFNAVRVSEVGLFVDYEVAVAFWPLRQHRRKDRVHQRQRGVGGLQQRQRQWW